MFAKDIMTKDVITIKPETTIHEAMKIIVEKEISGLIVLNDKDEVVGVLSEKDLLVAFDWLGVVKPSIVDYYNKNVVSVTEDTPVQDINRLLVIKNIKRVPVIKDKKVVGVVSRLDILRHILKTTPA